MAELVDAHGSGPCAFGCGGSSPSVGTTLPEVTPQNSQMSTAPQSLHKGCGVLRFTLCIARKVIRTSLICTYVPRLTCGANKLCSPLIMTRYPKLGVITLLACFSLAVIAGPAPWYTWRSKLDGKQVCAQTSLGQGWEKARGPFKDSHCTKLAYTQ